MKKIFLLFLIIFISFSGCFLTNDLPYVKWQDCGVIEDIDIVARSFNSTDKIIIKTDYGIWVLTYCGQTVYANEHLYIWKGKWKSE